LSARLFWLLFSTIFGQNCCRKTISNVSDDKRIVFRANRLLASWDDPICVAVRGEIFKRIFAPTEKLAPRREVGSYLHQCWIWLCSRLGAKLAPTRVLKNWPKDSQNVLPFFQWFNFKTVLFLHVLFFRLLTYVHLFVCRQIVARLLCTIHFFFKSNVKHSYFVTKKKAQIVKTPATKVPNLPRGTYCTNKMFSIDVFFLWTKYFFQIFFWWLQRLFYYASILAWRQCRYSQHPGGIRSLDLARCSHIHSDKLLDWQLCT
jgi:hypothetical protein